MSIFQTLFGGNPSSAPAQVAAPTGVANPGQPIPGTHSSPQTAPNGVVPSAQQVQQPAPGNTEPTQQSPLDGFKDIWQTPANPEGEANKGIFANLDPAKLMESARRVDFAKSITPENLQKIQAGGQDAVTAFADSLNSVAQTVYAQSAIATTKIVEQALGAAQKQYDAQLPTMVKRYSTGEALAANPLMANPAVQPLVQAAQEMFIRKNPNATSAEIQSQVNDYFNALGTAFAPKAPETAGQKSAKSQDDWSKFLSE